MPTQKDVARIAGVSVASVSRFLNKSGYISIDAKEKIIAAIKKTGYRPNLAARSLKSKRSGTIGCVFPDIENPFFIGFIKKIEHLFRKQGYNVILCNTENNPELEHFAIEMLLSRLIEGYLVIPCQEKLDITLSLLSESNLILVDRCPKHSNIPSVILDNRHGVFLAIEHLVELGHVEIAMVNVPEHTFTGNERFEGFKQATKHFGIPFKKEYRRIAGFTVESSYIKTMEILSLPTVPSAIIPMSGLTTVGTLKAVQDSGLTIPDDISVIGFDDFMYADLFAPPLTTIVQPSKLFAMAAAQLLQTLLRGEHPSKRQIVLQPYLQLRSSSAPPFTKNP
jgi:DNA-binding LacI/PurR family transcriptional regulator